MFKPGRPKWSRNRYSRRNPKNVSWEVRREILFLKATGWTPEDTARQMDLDLACIYRVLESKAWNWSLEELAVLAIGYHLGMPVADISDLAGRSQISCVHKWGDLCALIGTTPGVRRRERLGHDTEETRKIKELVLVGASVKEMCAATQLGKNVLLGKIHRLRKRGELPPAKPRVTNAKRTTSRRSRRVPSDPNSRGPRDTQANADGVLSVCGVLRHEGE